VRRAGGRSYQGSEIVKRQRILLETVCSAGYGLLVCALAAMPALASQGIAETVTITMKDRAFTPQRIVVKVGDTVKWENQDTELHNVISGATLYDPDLGHPMMSGVIMWNSTYAFSFAQPGSYRYMCVIHSSMESDQRVRGMIGEVIVESGEPAGASVEVGAVTEGHP